MIECRWRWWWWCPILIIRVMSVLSCVTDNLGCLPGFTYLRVTTMMTNETTLQWSSISVHYQITVPRCHEALPGSPGTLLLFHVRLAFCHHVRLCYKWCNSHPFSRRWFDMSIWIWNKMWQENTEKFSGFICSSSCVCAFDILNLEAHWKTLSRPRRGAKASNHQRRPEKIGEEDGDKRTHGHQGTIQTHDYAIQINPGTQAMQRKIITRQRRRTSKTKKRRERLWQFACFAIAGPICSRSDFELKTLWPRILVPVSNSIAFDMGFWLNWNTWKMCSPCVCLSNQLIWTKWKQKAGVEEEEENVLHFSRDYCVLGPEKGEEGKISAHFRGSIGVF